MKTFILALMGLGFCIQVKGESLSTIDGATYDNITTKRADPDGLYIEYTPAGGGLGMSKIKFSRLSPDQQKQFGYEPAIARDFEIKAARAMEDWRQQNLRLEQLGKAEREAREAREEQEQQMATDRLMAMAQLEQARADGGGAGYDWSSLGGGYGAFAFPETGNWHHRETAGTRGFHGTRFAGENPVRAPRRQP